MLVSTSLDSNNIDGLIDAIRLTRNLPDVNQKQLFASAIRYVIKESMLKPNNTVSFLL